jgi:hypothetical protein
MHDPEGLRPHGRLAPVHSLSRDRTCPADGVVAMRSVLLVLLLVLSGCAEGRWVHSTHGAEQAAQDWEICKAEVLSGQEHQKETMAGGINLSGCMKSKGYTYIEDRPPGTGADPSTHR